MAFRKSSNPVSVITVHKILRNPIYMGVFTRDGRKYHGKHRPLVTESSGSGCRKRSTVGSLGGRVE
jgi:Recombinase